MKFLVERIILCANKSVCFHVQLPFFFRLDSSRRCCNMYDADGNYIGPELVQQSRKKKRKKDVPPEQDVEEAPLTLPDPFKLAHPAETSLSSPFFTTLKKEAASVQAFGEKEDFVPKAFNNEDWVNPRLNPNMPRDTNVMGACSYGYDDSTTIQAEKVVLAPVAKEAAQREKEKEKEEREMERNRKMLQREKKSFNQREGRKRDLGQASGDKTFVEEEKRILRQQFEGF